jgi:hypothetical protein
MCLIGGAGVAEAGEAIAERYEVEPGRAAADVERLAAELLAENLLMVGAGGPEEAEPLPPAVAGSRAPYAEPVIVTFTDMEDLLAFDPPLPPGDHQVWEAAEPR